MPGAYLWGWDGATFRQVLTDVAGHLQVDIITGTAVETRCHGYDGGAWQRLRVESAANANLRTRLYDGVNPVVSVATAVSIGDANRGLFTQAGVRGRDAAFWKSINAEDNPLDDLSNDRVSLSSISKLYGFNGVTWSRLRVESDALFNLRVKLYDGANGIDSALLSSLSIPDAYRGLIVKAALHASYPPFNVWNEIRVAHALGDGEILNVALGVGLWGYNGATFDRLRTYGTGILKVGRAEVGLLTVRKTVVGQVGAAGARKLYWMTMNPTAANSVMELTDDTDGSTAVVWDMTHGVNAAHHMNMDPPMEFSNGIYLKTLNNFTSVIFGYL